MKALVFLCIWLALAWAGAAEILKPAHLPNGLAVVSMVYRDRISVGCGAVLRSGTLVIPASAFDKVNLATQSIVAVMAQNGIWHQIRVQGPVLHPQYRLFHEPLTGDLLKKPDYLRTQLLSNVALFATDSPQARNSDFDLDEPSPMAGNSRRTWGEFKAMSVSARIATVGGIPLPEMKCHALIGELGLESPIHAFSNLSGLDGDDLLPAILVKEQGGRLKLAGLKHRTFSSGQFVLFTSVSSAANRGFVLNGPSGVDARTFEEGVSPCVEFFSSTRFRYE